MSEMLTDDGKAFVLILVFIGAGLVLGYLGGLQQGKNEMAYLCNTMTISFPNETCKIRCDGSGCGCLLPGQKKIGVIEVGTSGANGQ